MVLQSDRNSGFFIFSKISLFLLLWNMFPWMPIKRLVAFSENERVEERKEKVKERAREREAKSNTVWIYSLRRNKSRSDLNCSAASPENSAFSSFCAKIRSFHFEGRRVSVSLSRLISLSDRILVAEWQKKKIET